MEIENKMNNGFLFVAWFTHPPNLLETTPRGVGVVNTY